MNSPTYRFVRIKRKDFDFPEVWVVCLDSLGRVFRYLEEVKSKQLWKALRGAKQKIAEQGENPHFNSMEWAVNTEIGLADDRGEERNTVFDDMKILGEKFNSPYIKFFLRSGPLYANPSGGFYPVSSMPHEILQIIECAEYEFPVETMQPDQSARILQWMGGGTHYYAKVGNIYVVIDGEQKWDTWEAAEKALKLFLANRV